MAQSILHVLSQIRGGAALSDADTKLAELVLAVKTTGKKGSITLKIDVEPDKLDETVVTLQPSLDIKTPKKPYAKGIFYFDEKTGAVSREDPRQAELALERQTKLEESGATAIDKVGRG